MPESAVLDTWATSSLTPVINENTARGAGYEEPFVPMTMRTQAHEIIRTWAFYTIVKSYYHRHTIPWKDVMICGFVLAKPGEKISKSKGNAKLTPKSLLETHPADMIRYWAASARLGHRHLLRSKRHGGLLQALYDQAVERLQVLPVPPARL